jgi:hypothetical protein
MAAKLLALALVLCSVTLSTALHGYCAPGEQKRPPSPTRYPLYQTDNRARTRAGAGPCAGRFGAPSWPQTQSRVPGDTAWSIGGRRTGKWRPGGLVCGCFFSLLGHITTVGMALALNSVALLGGLGLSRALAAWFVCVNDRT